MTTVDRLINDIIDREGGYVDHPADRGGPTKYGVTQTTLSAWLGRRATADEVRDLPRETAEVIYYREYYRKPGFEQLPEPLRPIMFDMAINHGPHLAVKILQRIVSRHQPIEIDGVIGPQTLAGIDAAMACIFVNAIVDARKDFYRRIITRDASQRVFIHGWLARAESFRV